MFTSRVLAAAAAVALTMTASAALAQDRSIGEDSPYRFSSASDRAVKQNNLQLFELNRNGYFEQIRAGNMGALAGASGLLGGSAANTNNSFTFIDQSQVTNNCSNSGGGSLVCSRGDNTVTGVTQTSTGNTQNADNTISGNEVTNRDNTTNIDTDGGTKP